MIEHNSEDHGVKHRRWPFLAVWGATTVGLVLALFIARPPETRSPTTPAPRDTAVAPSPSTAHCATGPSSLSSPSGVKGVALAWPLGIRAFADRADAVIDWTPGSLQLVNLIQVASAPAFSLRGHRCSDGRQLRFSYGGLPPVTSIASRPLPSAVFETAGEETVTFDAYEVNAAAPGSHFFLGFMLFPSEGDWAIETVSGDAVLGTAILRVAALAITQRVLRPSVGLEPDVRRLLGSLRFRPLIPDPSAVLPATAHAQLRSSCVGSNCLEIKWDGLGQPSNSVTILEGPAGCCLDAARPNAVRDIEIRPGTLAQFIPIQPEFGGPILWWVDSSSGDPVYVAISSPLGSREQLVRIAQSLRPLPPAAP